MLPPASLYELLTHLSTQAAAWQSSTPRRRGTSPTRRGGTNDVDAILKQDDADESLQRYKAQLLGAAAKGDRGDASDPRKLVVTEFRGSVSTRRRRTRSSTSTRGLGRTTSRRPECQ